MGYSSTTQVHKYIRDFQNKKIKATQKLYSSTDACISKQAQELKEIPTLNTLDQQLLPIVNEFLAKKQSSSRFSQLGNFYQNLRSYRDFAYTSMNRQQRLLDGLRLRTRRAYMNNKGRSALL